ncbi:MAG: hypothetical protein BZY88_12530 [SAR202 cluster bacterium Io17-Chloro-G9]|nr:MAG: hypothetical protein BZY88_12530 [SAR202 cluster bacterium Io17-Chloro-G9]
MRFWNILMEDVESTLAFPDKVLTTEKDRHNAIKRLGERFLRMTYKDEEDHILVVTVTPRRRPW